MTTEATRLVELVARYGSPLYVYDLGQVTAAWHALGNALPAEATRFFSLKANPHPAIAAHLCALGARAEVSSLGELAMAIDAGFPPAETLLTGPAKTRAMIDRALALGCRLFSVESLAELSRLSEATRCAGTTVTALLRANVDDSAPSAGLSFGGVPSQFGTDLSRLLDALCEGDVPTTGPVRVAGAHFFLATNLVDEPAVVANLQRAVAAAARLHHVGLPMSILDLGGGFGAPYGKPGPLPAYPRLRECLHALLTGVWPQWPRTGPEVWFESGRHLVATSGTLAATVVDVKYSKGERFVVLDAGIHHLGGMSGLRRLPRLDLSVCAVDGSRAPVSSDTHVVGPLCTTLDSWSPRASLPDVRPGDVVSVPNVGAYGLSASLLAFLSHDCPVEVVVTATGEEHASRLVLDRRAVQPEPSPGGST